ncbi:hypothetical protein D3C73_1520140 [compost metagenome]
MVRKKPLRLVDLLQVDLQWPICNQLNIIEAGNPLPVEVHSRKAGGGVDDRLAQCLPHGAAPACLEGPLYLVASIRRRRGGQPERIRRFDSCQIDA